MDDRSLMYMTAERYLRYLAELKAVPVDLIDERVEELFHMVELFGERKKRFAPFPVE